MEQNAQIQVSHTPGPWTYRDTGWGAFGVYADAYPTVDGPFHLLGRTSNKGVLDEANVRLIAAAPELLEALEGLLAGTGWHEIDGTCSLCTDARKAVKKARGE